MGALCSGGEEKEYEEEKEASVIENRIESLQKKLKVMDDQIKECERKAEEGLQRGDEESTQTIVKAKMELQKRRKVIQGFLAVNRSRLKELEDDMLEKVIDNHEESKKLVEEN